MIRKSQTHALILKKLDQIINSLEFIDHKIQQYEMRKAELPDDIYADLDRLKSKTYDLYKVYQRTPNSNISYAVEAYFNYLCTTYKICSMSIT